MKLILKITLIIELFVSIAGLIYYKNEYEDQKLQLDRLVKSVHPGEPQAFYMFNGRDPYLRDISSPAEREAISSGNLDYAFLSGLKSGFEFGYLARGNRSDGRYFKTDSIQVIRSYVKRMRK